MQRILLVEDNEMNRDLISRRLKRRGYAVIIATDGAAGVETATREKPDLILMDIGLPLIDGYEATRMIKADEATRHTPVIGLSAHAMSGDADRALEAGCDDYDTKPIEWPRLLSKIQGLLEKAAEKKAAAEKEKEPSAASSPGTGIRLLVLGESAMRTEMLTGRLASMGHAFVTVGETASAVEKLVADSFDGVFFDVALEGRDGRSPLEELRRASAGQPIFVYCAIDTIPEAIHCLERGASEFIPQPFRPEELRHRLDTHLELARHRQRPPSPEGGKDGRRVEHLMRAMLPPAWIDELRQLHKLPPRRLDEVALLQWDLPALAQQLAASETAAMARFQRLAVGFEEIAGQHGSQVVDIDNLGVLVMAEAADREAAARAAVASGLELASMAAETGEQLRAAVHVGPVVAGVIGHRTWRFGLWGGSVTLVQQACHSVAQGVHVTETLRRQLHGKIKTEPSGSVPIEGGALALHRVLGLSP